MSAESLGYPKPDESAARQAMIRGAFGHLRQSEPTARQDASGWWGEWAQAEHLAALHYLRGRMGHTDPA